MYCSPCDERMATPPARKRAGTSGMIHGGGAAVAVPLMLADGVPLVTISNILGHVPPAITAAISAHALDDQKAGAIASLGRRLRRATNDP